MDSAHVLPDEVASALAAPVGEEPLSPLATPRVTRGVLDAFGLATKKKLGQNFLVNDAILQKIVHLAALDSEDFVLEVGPGIGTLTIALLKSAGRVLSVERDPDLPSVLAETTQPWADRFALVEKDGLDLVVDDIEEAFGRSDTGVGLPTKFVANLPYAVAATLILDYFERFPWLESATVMVQKEVADRIAASPGSKNYGAYTVKLGLYAQVVDRFIVSPNNFFPPPHVDSAVVRMDRATPVDDEGTPLSAEDVRYAAMMADAAFASRRKTMGNSFKAYFASRGQGLTGDATLVPRIFERAGIDASRRGETLSQVEFVRLGRAFASLLHQS